MPSRTRQNQDLACLIKEQEKDQQTRHVYSERIVPRKKYLFQSVASRLRACLILSLFMPRREVANALNIRPGSVTKYIKRGLKHLNEREAEQYIEYKKMRN